MSDRNNVGRMVKVSEAHDRHRLRPLIDQHYLAALSERMADALGLPLATAKARVQQLAVSATGTLDPGGDARWWKAPRSKP